MKNNDSIEGYENHESFLPQSFEAVWYGELGVQNSKDILKKEGYYDMCLVK